MREYIDFSSERLNHEANLWAGCTLKELLLIIGMNMLVLGISLMGLSWILWGRVIWGVMAMLLVLIPLSSIGAIRWGQFKKNKPLFYVEHYCRKKRLCWLGLKDFFVLDQSIYSVYRIGEAFSSNGSPLSIQEGRRDYAH